ncbi:MAG: glycerol-3-phosphate 1-O-acyltransferase PlsY [Oceanipulchritudo sp.]
MDPALLYPLSLGTGYLIGSISFAVLIAKVKGVDIFTVGSGNPGATNIMRALGQPYGYGCFLLDALKGVAAVLLGQVLAGHGPADPQLMGILALLGSILGHSFSLFLRFRGGKGVATTVGGLFTLIPVVMFIGAVLWLVVFALFRYVSLASLVLGLSLPVSAVFLKTGNLNIALCSFLALLIGVRHRSNIERLLKGTENRTGGTRRQ